jgi:hypothetical protein
VSSPGGKGSDAALPEVRQSARAEAFSRPVAKTFFVVLFSGFGLIFFSGIVVPSTNWWEKLLLGLPLAGLVLVVARVARLAIVAEPGRLVIKNLRNTQRIPWSQIENITEPGPVPVAVYRENALAHQDMKLQVVLRDGAVISATLYDERMFGYRYGDAARRQDVIAQLNQFRLERS